MSGFARLSVPLLAAMSFVLAACGAPAAEAPVVEPTAAGVEVPISTLPIEVLMQDLKRNYAIITVTHNMQQAARVSDYTAMMMLEGDSRSGTVIEFAETKRIFTNPGDKRTEDYVTGRFG